MNLTELWNYMQCDLEAERFGNEMRQSEKRKLLLKQQEFLKEQQSKFAKIQTDVSQMASKMEELKQESERLNGLLEAFQNEMGDIDSMEAETVEEKIKTAERILAAIEACDKALAHIRKESEIANRSENEVKKNAAKTKQEYDAVKKEYDIEFAKDKLKLKALRDEADKEAEKLDAADLEKYRQVKQHVMPPIAKLVNNQCTGCFMTLPLGTLREIKAGSVLTCDNCGRILFVEN